MRALLAFLTPFAVLASIPTMEGLFRNPGNADLDGNIVVAHVLMEKAQEGIVATSDKKIYLKLIFSLENEKNPALLQILYNSPKMSPNAILGTTYFSSFRRSVRRDDNLERALIFSLFDMFLLNDSNSIAQVFKRVASSFVTNREILNHKKLKFYRDYRRHLRKSKNRGFKGESPRVRELRKMSLYGKSSAVKLVREGGQFFWKIELKNLVARFSNNRHHLRDFILSTSKGNIDVRTDDVILFDGIHELPKSILIRSRFGEDISLKFLKMANFAGRSGHLKQKIKKYRKLEKKYRKENFQKRAMLRDFYVY